jgi:hypothetical protein
MIDDALRTDWTGDHREHCYRRKKRFHEYLWVFRYARPAGTVSGGCRAAIC